MLDHESSQFVRREPAIRISSETRIFKTTRNFGDFEHVLFATGSDYANGECADDVAEFQPLRAVRFAADFNIVHVSL